MDFVYHRTYRSRVKAVIFDWAGTTVDFGCCAPANVFQALFKKHGIDITAEQAREPMGMHKRDHIRILSQLESVAQQWQHKHGHRPNEEDISTLFAEFVPLQVEAIADHADIIPGTLDTMAWLRAHTIKVGSTTGYNAEMMKGLVDLASEAGYTPETMVCVSDVPEGRPAPWMALEAAKRLGVYPLEACVKVGDTPADISEGLNAGMWTVGVVEHGNEVGLNYEEWHAASASERAPRAARAEARLATAGAHYVIATIADLPKVIESINLRLAAGDKP